MDNEKTILVQQADQYGALVYHPACGQSDIFAKIAKTKTLTGTTLNLIKSLGYKIEIAQAKNVFY